MKKILLVLLFNILLALPALALYGHFDEFDKEPEVHRVNLVIPKGSYFRGFIGQAVSSEFNNTGDIIKILITSDYTIDNKVLIPENSIFVGVIKSLGKAQRGMDGYFSIDIVGLVFPDGRQFNAQGYVTFGHNNRVLGGAFSRRVGHKSVLHKASAYNQRGINGILQLQQNGPRMMGKETKLKMGDLVEFVLEEEIDVN